MTTRLAAWKRALVFLSVGGSPFVFFGGFGNVGGCVQPRNADFVNFYQASGTASIQAISDSNLFNDAAANSDYDTIVRTPATNFVTALWDNWVSLQFPLDPGTGNVFRQ